MFIDSHAHLGDDSLFSEWKEILQRASEAKVDAVINICTNSETLERGLLMQKSSPPIHVVLAAATTPHDVEKEGDSFFKEVEGAALQKKLVAIGETGLDYYYEYSPKETQKKHLVKYFHLAKKLDLPVVFHCRDAFSDLLELAEVEYQSPKALLHCFTGTLEEAKQVLNQGWGISFSGIVTFKKSAGLRDVIKYAPLESMFIETDSPYLAPQTKRGSRNEPSFVVETARLIADLKGVSIEEVAQKTTHNARSLFSF